MIKKKLIVLAILLISLLCLSAVSAVEDATSDIAIIDTNEEFIFEDNICEDVLNSNNDEELFFEEDNNDDAVLTSVDEETEVSEAETKSFTDLNTAINGVSDSEITLRYNYTYSDSDSNLREGIVINRPVTIMGNDITINGANSARIFYIESEGVTIQGINFLNGRSTLNGGAIYASDEDLPCTVKNCSFISNYAISGGAIYNGNANNCTFERNAGTYGGAIYNGNATNCTFKNNSMNFGGTIYIGNANNCAFENNYAPQGAAIYNGNATNCNFTNNNASAYGGAIYNGNATNCTFENNRGQSGGAIYNSSASNCNFTNNNANDFGGAICNGNATNCNFTNNTSNGKGGAIYEGNAINCAFSNNNASSPGGAICNGNATNSNFTNNTSKGPGGAIYNGNATNCTFINNVANEAGGAICNGNATNGNFTNNTARIGGAIFQGNATDCNFTYNSAGPAGGAIYIGNANNCTFINNTAEQVGAAIYDGNAKNCTFINHTVTYSGAALNRGNAIDSTFINNTVKFEGGAIYGGNASNCTFKNNVGGKGGAMAGGNASNCTFINNTATESGGAMYSGNANRSTFLLNFATESGTENTKDTLCDDDCEFVVPAFDVPENICTDDITIQVPLKLRDGDTYYEGYNTTMEIYQGEELKETKYVLTGEEVEIGLEPGIYTVTFSIENSNVEPAIIRIIKTDGTTFLDLNKTINSNEYSEISLNKSYAYNPEIDSDFRDGIIINHTIIINGNDFTIDGNNMARIFKIVAEDVLIKNINFINGNKGSDNGGALYIDNCINTAIENCTFINNYGRIGGAIYSYNTNVTLSNCKIDSNKAMYAIIYLENGDLCTVDHCNFTYNNATNGYGALHFYKTKGSVKNSYFENNTGVTGGGISFYYEGIVENSLFINNTATGSNYARAGAIYFDSDYDRVKIGIINNCNFTNNIAPNSAVYFDQFGIVNNSNFNGHNCIAIEFGGYDEELESIVENSNFTDNTVERYGTVYINGNAVVDNCNFINNIQTGDSTALGGALSFNRDGTVKNSNFINNSVTSGWTASGGAIRFSGYGIVDNCNFTNNSASGPYKSYGGAIYFSSDGRINNSNFINNNAYGDNEVKGGAAHFSSRVADIENCNFDSNQGNLGGAISFFNNGTIDNCSFTNNKGQLGGAIYGEYANSASRGAIITQCTFDNNSAENGGALYFTTQYDNYDGCVYLSDSNLTNNNASNYGAAYFNCENGTVINCIFENNSANENGGALSWNRQKNGMIRNCSFIANSAENGGALYESNATNCSFINNTATTGGAVSGGTITDSYFINNTATTGGAMIGGTAKNSTFVLNFASESGTEEIKDTDYDEDCKFIIPKFIAPNKIIQYENSVILPLDLSEEGTNYDGYNITIRLTKNGETETFYRLSGEEIEFNLEPGTYHVTLSLENSDVETLDISIGITDGTSFWDLNRTINGNDNSEITLDKNYTYVPNIDDDVKDGILINRDLTLDGNGSTLDGNHMARIFNVTATKTSFKNINFVNGNASEGNGGAITFESYSESSIKDCNFTGNNANNGGAIYGGTAENCTFIDNIAVTGGAIDHGIATDCSFTNNKGQHAGGAISEGNAKNCTFTSNYAGGYGGAIYQGNADNCTFIGSYCGGLGGAIYKGTASNSNFINSTVSGLGGAIHTGNATNCNFTNSTAKDGSGGAIYNGNAINCNFTNSNASGPGGAIHTGNATNCTFITNTAIGPGGSIFDGNAENCRFINSTSSVAGGAIYNGNAINCNFTNNSVNGPGGAIFNGNAINCNFTNNSAELAGALYKGNASNCTFISNNANESGGAMYNGYAIDCAFINNSAKDYGALYSANAINCNFTGNHADNNGGAIYSANAINCTFTENTANTGGAIYQGNATNCNFTNNNADTDGGAISNSNATNCNFTGNTAKTSGGAISNGNATNCNFTNNSAINRGGAISAGNAENCIFIGNSANSYGGAISNGNATGCHFINNSAKSLGRGGAIYIGNANNSTFINNTASSGTGGAIYQGNANNSTFINNTATIRGGAISNGNATGCYFINNTANREGAMYKGTAKDSTFVLNFASLEGTEDVSDVTAENCNFIVPAFIVKEDVDSLDYGDKLTIRLLDGNTFYDGYNATITIYQGEELISSSNVLTGDDWTFDLMSGEYTINISLKNSNVESLILTLTGNPTPTEITASDVNTSYNSDDSMTITLKDVKNNPIANVQLSIDINGNSTDKLTDENGQIFLPAKNFDAGTYIVTITYGGNEAYNGSSARAVMRIDRITPKITVTGSSVEYGEESTVNVTVTDQNDNPISGAVIVTVDWNNGIKEIIELDGEGKGQARFRLDSYNVPSGTYDVNATYILTDNYNSVCGETTLTITESKELVITITANEVRYGEDVIIDVAAVDGEGKPVTVEAVNITIGDETKEYPIENGQVNLGKLSVGTEVTVEVNDGVHDETEKTFKVDVTPAIPTISVSYESGLLSITLTGANDEKLNETVYYSIDSGNTEEVLTVNGTFEINPMLEIGDHSAYVVFRGNENYVARSNNTYFNIPKGGDAVLNISVEPASILETENATIKITLMDDTTPIHGTVIVTVNDVSYAINVTKGEGSITINKLEPGNYTVSAIFIGDEKYREAIAENKTLEVIKEPTIHLDVSTDGDNLIVKLTDDDGNPINGAVNVTIDGVTNEVNVVDGITKVPTQAGDHTISVSIGDIKSPETKVVTSKKVKRIATSLSISPLKKLTFNKAVDKKKNYYIYATLKDSQGKVIKGKTVQYTTNGKVYKATTNSKGQIKFVFAKASKGKYTISVSFLGDDDYMASFKAASIKVTPQKAKIKIAKKKFKAKTKVKKVRVTLKNSKGKALKGKKITLVVKKKKYTKKTNKKGKAVFKIKKLNKKGKYKIVAKFKGDKTYKKVTKKAKITVK